MQTEECVVCGAETVAGVSYTTGNDDGAIVKLPSFECSECGAIHPDGERGSGMPIKDVPAGGRLRCMVPSAHSSKPDPLLTPEGSRALEVQKT